MSRPRDTARLDDAARALAADPEHLRSARILARRFARGLPWLAEDLEGAALAGLVDAARKYRPERGVKFAAYLVSRVRGALLDCCRATYPLGYQRARRRAGRRVPAVGSLAAVPAGETRPLAELIAADEEPVGSGEDGLDEFRGLLRGTTAAEKEALRLLYSDPATPTMKLVGARLGLSESRVSQLTIRGLAMIRDRLQLQTPATNGHTPTAKDILPAEDEGTPHTPAPATGRRAAHPDAGRPCVACGKARARNGRCFGCKSSTKARVPARATAASPGPAPAPPAPLSADLADVLRELDALRAIVGVLAGLDAPARARVVRWLADRGTPP